MTVVFREVPLGRNFPDWQSQPFESLYFQHNLLEGYKMADNQNKDFDDAVAIGEEIEKQVTADMGSTVTPLGVELILANMLIACFYPAVWVLVVLFYVTAIAAGVNRSAAKDALKKHDVNAAKAAISVAKGWSIGLGLTQVGMAIVELWALGQLVKSFKGQ